MATVERVFENIIHCHFEDGLFDSIRHWLKEEWKWEGELYMHDLTLDIPERNTNIQVNHTQPDKFLGDRTGNRAAAIVDFKVGSRGTSRNKIIQQMSDYQQLFGLPVILIQAIKWHATDYDLKGNRDIFVFDCHFPDIIDLALDCNPADHPGRSHAAFLKTENAYLLNQPGPSEEDTCGLIWSVKYRDICLPLQGLTRGTDPYLFPFPTEKRKQAQYDYALETRSESTMKRLNTDFKERVRAEEDDRREWQVVWPCPSLKDECTQLLNLSS